MSERKDFTELAGAALANHRLVKLSGDEVIYNTETATDVPIGVTKLNVKDEDDVSITPVNQGGSIEIEAAGAIDKAADVYAAAEGRIQALPATAGDYRKIGLAMQAASGEGSIIEVLPYDNITITTVS